MGNVATTAAVISVAIVGLMMLTGRIYAGEEAVAVGLCQYLTDGGSFDKAMEIVGNRFGVEKFDRFDPDMTVNTLEGPKPMVNRVASYWAGGLNIEIIQPAPSEVEPDQDKEESP